MVDLQSQVQLKHAQLVLGTGERAESYDGRFLLSALLVYVAKGDGTISDSESQKMLDLLCSRFDIRSSEAMERLSSAVMALADDTNIDQTLRTLSADLSSRETQDVFAMMLEIAAADGSQDAREIAAINVASEVLGMSADEVHAAYSEYFAGH